MIENYSVRTRAVYAYNLALIQSSALNVCRNVESVEKGVGIGARTVNVKSYTKKIRQLCRDFKMDRIILDPPYQRRPAWTSPQRVELLNSIFNGIPIPAVILYRTKGPKGAIRHEVMDGKQRLETIFHFRYGGVIKDEQKLGFLLRRDESKNRKWYFYKDLRNPESKQDGLSVTKFVDYKLPVVEYAGELVGLIGQKIAEKEIFAKINSTGSKLTKNEIRHSKSTPFFELGSHLESRWKNKIVDKWKVFSRAEVSRYQYHEFMLELCTIVLYEGISDKRIVLEQFMRTQWKRDELRQCEKGVNAVILWITKILRDHEFTATRFNRKGDFYTLFAILANLQQRNAVTTDRRLNRRARETLIGFSKKAHKVDGSIVKYLPARLSVQDRDIARYIVSTREGTDQFRNRRNRDEILRPLLESVFTKRKSSRRIFQKAEKQALWLRSKPRNGKIWCPNPNHNPKCIGRMDFSECEVDHRVAYVKGGDTNARNGQLLCKSCNRSKGSK